MAKKCEKSVMKTGLELDFLTNFVSWRIFGGYFEDSCRILEGIWRIFGGFLRDFWRILGGFLEDS